MTSRDARSSPIHDLDDALALDGSEYLYIEQYIDPLRPEIGRRDVKILVSSLGGTVSTTDPMLWQSGEPILWQSGEPIIWST